MNAPATTPLRVHYVGIALYGFITLWICYLIGLMFKAMKRTVSWTLCAFLICSLLSSVVVIVDLSLEIFMPNFSVYDNHFVSVMYILQRSCYTYFAYKQLELGYQLHDKWDNFSIRIPLAFALTVLVLACFFVLNMLDSGKVNQGQLN